MLRADVGNHCFGLQAHHLGLTLHGFYMWETIKQKFYDTGVTSHEDEKKLFANAKKLCKIFTNFVE